MARPSRFVIAKTDIFEHFDNSSKRVYSASELSGILAKNRDFWRLAARTNVHEFVQFLIKQGRLTEHVLRSTTYAREIIRYSWGAASKFELALSIQSRGYLSHATAVSLHGLTDLVPKVLYLNIEQSPKPAARSPLSQRGIDHAFSRRQRQSNLIYDCEDWSVTIISGKNTNNLGVEEIRGPDSEKLSATNLERTLIDIVVRPAYSGGIFQTLNAYRAAKNKLSTNRLISILKKLDYIYPYHQAIGFLMEAAGYDEKRYAMLQRLGIEYNFYLVHGMQNPSFSQKWKLFFPQGI